MASELRIKKMVSFLKNEISSILSKILNDRGIYSVVSIFDVELSVDMRYAKVKISVFSQNPSEVEEISKTILRNKPIIRKYLSKVLKTMYVPELWFEFLNLFDSMKVYEKIKELEDNDNKE